MKFAHIFLLVLSVFNVFIQVSTRVHHHTHSSTHIHRYSKLREGENPYVHFFSGFIAEFFGVPTAVDIKECATLPDPTNTDMNYNKIIERIGPIGDNLKKIVDMVQNIVNFFCDWKDVFSVFKVGNRKSIRRAFLEKKKRRIEWAALVSHIADYARSKIGSATQAVTDATSTVVTTLSPYLTIIFDALHAIFNHPIFIWLYGCAMKVKDTFFDGGVKDKFQAVWEIITKNTPKADTWVKYLFKGFCKVKDLLDIAMGLADAISETAVDKKMTILGRSIAKLIKIMTI